MIFATIKRWFSQTKAPGQETECKHSWSREYDYTTYSGAVRVVESYCTKCKIPASGGGQ